MTILTKDELKILHPDFNGGDASQLDKLRALISERKLKRIKEHCCDCGCGRKTYNPKSTFRVKRFYSKACHRAYIAIQYKKKLLRYKFPETESFTTQAFAELNKIAKGTSQSTIKKMEELGFIKFSHKEGRIQTPELFYRKNSTGMALAIP